MSHAQVKSVNTQNRFRLRSVTKEKPGARENTVSQYRESAYIYHVVLPDFLYGISTIGSKSE